MRQQLRHVVPQLARRHEQYQGAAAQGDGIPMNGELALVRILVSREHCKRRGEVAMREWNAGIRGHGDRGGHARYDFEGNARSGKSGGLFGTPTEDERVAALEPNDDTT